MEKNYSSAPARKGFLSALGTLALGSALLLSSAAQAQTATVKLEAESATLSGAAMLATTITPFSGTGYVDFTNKPSSVTFTYNATAAGPYDMVIRYESHFGTKLGDLSVNGAAKFPVYFNSTETGATFRSTSTLQVSLKAGDNTIVISDNYAYYGIDYITLKPSAATPAALTPTAAGRVEAELGNLKATQAIVRDDDKGTHSGTAYVGSFAENQSAGSTITLPINIATAGTYQIAVGARGLFGGKSFDLVVANSADTGAKVTTMLPESPDAFMKVVAGTYNLVAGTNTLTLTSQTGYLEVDYVDVTPSVTTAVKANSSTQLGFAVYPNPATTDALNVKYQAAARQEAVVSLVSTIGQRVRTMSRTLQTGENQFQLSTDGVANGLYQVVVSVAGHTTAARRVVIAR